MDHEEFLDRRCNSLMKRVSSMSLAEASVAGDPAALPAAARLLDTYFARPLTRSEHVQAREVASRLGIDLMQFDQEQVKLEKENGHV